MRNGILAFVLGGILLTGIGSGNNKDLNVIGNIIEINEGASGNENTEESTIEAEAEEETTEDITTEDITTEDADDKEPVLTVAINGQTKEWTRENVRLDAEAYDEGVGLDKLTVLLNEETIFEEDACDDEGHIIFSYLFDKDGIYNIKITATDLNGNEALYEELVMVDKTAPVLLYDGVKNGTHLAKNVQIKTAACDNGSGNVKVLYYLRKEENGSYVRESVEDYYPDKEGKIGIRNVFKEGSYLLYICAFDGAGNKTVSEPLSFVIDKTSPVIELSGLQDGSFIGEDGTLNISVFEEDYEATAFSVSVENEDNKECNETKNMTLSAKRFSFEKVFKEGGAYRVSVTARDGAGNFSRKEISFVIDKEKPVIKVRGVKDYERRQKKADIRIDIKEKYGNGNKVVLMGKKLDLLGRVSVLSFPEFSLDKEDSTLNLSYDDDAFYEITVEATDAAGNVKKEEINFVIDSMPPIIAGVEKYDGKYLQEFSLGDEVNAMFLDLTYLEQKITLDGMDYNGVDVIKKEGCHVLCVSAKDELGHETQKSARFVIDRTPPEIAFSVEDGEVLEEAGCVDVSVKDPEDEICEITLNGKKVSGNKAEYDKEGKYELSVKACDKAGNRVTKDVHFLYNRKGVKNETAKDTFSEVDKSKEHENSAGLMGKIKKADDEKPVSKVASLVAVLAGLGIWMVKKK